MPDNGKIREIRDRLDAIAPLPPAGPVPAVTLARNLAVQAQERWTRSMSRAPGTGIDRGQIEAMCAEFAAAAALYALAATEHGDAELPLGIEPAVPEVLRGMRPAQVAALIRDCWEDGGSVGEFLWEFLGRELAGEVSQLAGELAAFTARPERPRIVCLCGSTRFMDAFHEAGWQETLAGRIVLSVGVAKHVRTPDGGHAAEALGSGVAEALDDLHRRKIDLADEVLVVSDASGYYGDSTRGEIAYARSLGKPVRFQVPAAEAAGLVSQP